MTRAATGPALRALSQCSLRRCRWMTGWYALATSPAAYTSGALVLSDASVRMPLLERDPGALGQRGVRHRADPDQHEVGGHGFAVDDDSLGALSRPTIRSTCTPVRRSTPFSVVEARGTPHPSPGRPRAPAARGRARGSSPRFRVSAPLRRPPCRSTPSRSARAACRHHAAPRASASESSRRRSVCTPSRSCPSSGSDRGDAPVASSTASYARSPPSVSSRCAAGSRRGRRRGHAQIDIALGVPRRGMQHRGIQPLLAREIALRQRRALVGRMGLGGHDRHIAGVPVFAQGLGGLSGGDSPADDHEVSHDSSSSGPPHP